MIWLNSNKKKILILNKANIKDIKKGNEVCFLIYNNKKEMEITIKMEREE